ncbi:MAG: carbonic anhydrase [Sideroxydans sp.]|nr:carbonic anhydrase [Sideroxydans sp.]
MIDIKQLIEGFRRFRHEHFAEHDTLYQQLVEQGQTPQVLVVACCDSRVDPALVFNCHPGDLFVIRNVANLVPPLEGHSGHHGTTAAIEYGVKKLGVKHIIVLGHAHCGGITALVNSYGVSTPDSYMDDWMSLAEGARKEMEAELHSAEQAVKYRECEMRAILVSLENLKTFPWINERLNDGSLILHGWYFDIGQGELLRYEESSRTFQAA